MMRRVIAGMSVFVSLLAPACASPRHSPARVPAAPAGPEMEFPLGAHWRLVEMNGRPIPAGIDATLTIDHTLRGSGDGGCNTWSATIYPVRGQRLAVGPMAVTRMACKPAVMAFERAYLTAVHAGPRWEEANGYLVLRSPAGTLKFARGI